MSINDSTLCTVAKKLHGINPDVFIDDPHQVEELLVDWWDKFIDDKMEFPPATDADEDTALNKWIQAYLNEPA